MKKGILLILLFVGLFYSSAQSTGKYKIKFLEINKENSDYGVAILDNNKLIFTSASEKVKSSRKNYNPRKDLYVGDIDFSGEINNVKLVINNSDTKFNETGATYTSDKRTVYFSRNKYVKKLSKQKLPKNQRLELYKADVDVNGNWINIKKLPFNKKAYSSGYQVGKQKLRVYDTTNTAVLLTGKASLADVTSLDVIDVSVMGQITLADVTVIRLDHYTELIGNMGMSVDDGGTETYSTIKITQRG